MARCYECCQEHGHADGCMSGNPGTEESMTPPTEQQKLMPCKHGKQHDSEWCESCFRKEQRQRWGYSNYDYCDLLGREHG
jgi:hypothetical protein